MQPTHGSTRGHVPYGGHLHRVISLHACMSCYVAHALLFDHDGSSLSKADHGQALWRCDVVRMRPSVWRGSRPCKRVRLVEFISIFMVVHPMRLGPCHFICPVVTLNSFVAHDMRPWRGVQPILYICIHSRHVSVACKHVACISL